MAVFYGPSEEEEEEVMGFTELTLVVLLVPVCLVLIGVLEYVVRSIPKWITRIKRSRLR